MSKKPKKIEIKAYNSLLQKDNFGVPQALRSLSPRQAFFLKLQICS